MSADFKSLLNKKVEDVKKPPVLHPGVYEGVVKGHKFEEREYSKGNPTAVCSFNLQLTGATEDIDPEDLLDSEGKPIDVSKYRQRYDYSIEESEVWKLKEFLTSCGIEFSGRSLGECIPDTTNAPVLITIIHKPNNTPGGDPYVNVGRITGTANVSA